LEAGNNCACAHIKNLGPRTSVVLCDDIKCLRYGQITRNTFINQQFEQITLPRKPSTLIGHIGKTPKSLQTFLLIALARSRALRDDGEIRLALEFPSRNASKAVAKCQVVKNARKMFTDYKAWPYCGNQLIHTINGSYRAPGCSRVASHGQPRDTGKQIRGNPGPSPSQASTLFLFPPLPPSLLSSRSFPRSLPLFFLLLFRQCTFLRVE